MIRDFLEKLLYFVRWDQGQYRSYRRKYHVHPQFRFNGPRIAFYGEGRIILGEGSYIGNDSYIEAFKGFSVRIGKFCRVASHVKIYTMGYDADLRVGKNGNVTIGDHCWIGANVFINPDVCIGDHSVIGANSVVTHDVPSYCVVAGCPARFIKQVNR